MVQKRPRVSVLLAITSLLTLALVALLAVFQDSAFRIGAIYIYLVFVSAMGKWRAWRMYVSLLLALMLADYDLLFGISEANLRIWYVFAVPIIFRLLTREYVKRYVVWVYCLLLYLLTVSVLLGGALDFLKYSVYALTVVAIADAHARGVFKIVDVLPVLMAPIYVCLVQLGAYLVLGIDTFLWEAPRPSAFFSESTWMGAYCVPIAFILLRAFQNSEISGVNASTNVALTILILTLTLSINAIFAIGLFCFAFLLSLRTRLKYVLFVLLVFVLAAVFDWLIGERLTHYQDDVSLGGRIEAFDELLLSASTQPWYGSGFRFDYEQEVVASGAALGAKAFSFPFQLLAVGGFPLLTFYIVVVLRFAVRMALRKDFVSLLLLFSFVFMSSFAPLAQGVVGSITIVLLFACATEWIGRSDNSYRVRA